MIRIEDKHIICPECGEPMMAMYGCGWDYDRFICSKFMCDGEIELETITYYEQVVDNACKE
jgi:hypothetical protein